MGDETIDTTAREKAEKAMTIAELARQDIRGHKINCGERWDVARAAMADVKTQIERVDSRQRNSWRWVVGLIVGGQGSVILLLVADLLRGGGG